MAIPHISIISSSVRIGRNSHRVALYFEKYLTENALASVTILDLLEYNFPLFDERLSEQKNPAAAVIEFAQKVKSADAIIIVTPEYNGGIPASLKNVIDLLYQEWQHKPVAISTVSSGPFGGSQVLVSLQFTLWKIGALTVTKMFPVASVQDAFDAVGEPKDKQATDKRAASFISGVLAAVAPK